MTGFSDPASPGEILPLRQGNDQEDAGFSLLARRSSILQTIAVDPTQTDFVIRGVVASKTGFEKIQSRALVGLYLDDAPVALSGYNPNFRLVDMDRAEILPGPQSVRFGQSAAAGVVRLITAPVDLSQSAGHVELGSAVTDGGGPSGGISGVANLVLVPGKAALRLVAYTHHDGGYLDNTVLGQNDTNTADTFGGRAKLLVQIDPQTSMTLAGTYQVIEEQDGFAASDTAGGLYRRNSLRLEPAFARNGVVGLGLARTADMFDISANISGIFARNGVAPEIGGETAFFAHLVNPTVAVPVYDTPLNTRTASDGVAAELKLSSHAQGRLHWLVGLSASEDRRALSQVIDVPGFDALTGANSTLFGVPADRLAQIDLSYRTAETAAFADFDMALTDTLQATLGLRAHHARVSGQLDFRGLGEGGIEQSSPRQNSDGFTPEFTLRYRPDSDDMVYARVAKGYRLGGINSFVSPVVCAADLAGLGLSKPNPSFAPDSVWSYEAGGRTTLAEGRLDLGATVFALDWTHVQTLTQLACGFNTILNGGHLASKGAELAASWRPIDGLTLSATATYTDSRFGAGSPSAGTPAGTEAPFTPHWAATIGARYDTSLLGKKVFVAVDYHHAGDRFDDPDIRLRQTMPAHDEADLRTGVDVGSWALSIFAENITNSAGLLSAVSFPFSHYPGRRLTYDRPRTIGVSASHAF